LDFGLLKSPSPDALNVVMVAENVNKIEIIERDVISIQGYGKDKSNLAQSWLGWFCEFTA
jgi:hypothetical protein